MGGSFDADDALQAAATSHDDVTWTTEATVQLNLLWTSSKVARLAHAFAILLICFLLVTVVGPALRSRPPRRKAR